MVYKKIQMQLKNTSIYIGSFMTKNVRVYTQPGQNMCPDERFQTCLRIRYPNCVAFVLIQ